ncbi:cytochrome P450 [Backusella circina FSU 941]|nr:cytochrome P450 [Backusella circina FSU 941]
MDQIQHHIQHAVSLVRQLPISQHLELFYKRSSRNELIFLGGATLLTLYNFAAYIKASRQKLNLPPTVGYNLPIVGHSLYMLANPHKFIDWCNDKYGEVYDLNLFGKTVTVASGRSAEEVLKADADKLSLEHGILIDLLHLNYFLDATTMEIGFLANPTAAKLSIPPQRMPTYVPGLQEGLDRALVDLVKGKETYLVEKPSVFFQNFVAYMSVPTLVGEEFKMNPHVIKSFAEFTNDITGNIGIFMAVPKSLHRYVIPYISKVQEHTKVMNDYILPTVKAYRANPQQFDQKHGPNFLQGLADYIKPDGTTYTDREVANSVLLIAFASVHTTSMNMSFALYWLLARPDLLKQFLDEIDRVLPGDTPVTFEALKEMTFLENFMRESFRQSADKLANGKKAMVDYTFANGYQIPKGRVVESTARGLNMGTNLNRSKIEEMDPTQSFGKPSTAPARDFVTFGLGKHLCPGRFFAVLEIKMSLIQLFREFDIKVASGRQPIPVNNLAGKVSVNSEEPLIFTKKYRM